MKLSPKQQAAVDQMKREGSAPVEDLRTFWSLHRRGLIETTVVERRPCGDPSVVVMHLKPGANV